MEASSEGLSFWYGRSDAPAPPERGADRAAASLTVGVRPPSPANVVRVDYRVDGGGVRTIPAVTGPIVYGTDAQYFVARFPCFTEGELVEYAAVLTCAGRRVPALGREDQRWSSFRLAAAGGPGSRVPALSAGGAVPAVVPPPLTTTPSLPFGLDYVATMTIQLGPPEVIGDTAEGVRLNFYVSGGTVRGPQLRGFLRPRGGDNLLVRRDGVAVVSAGCVVETPDGAVLAANLSGVTDFGPNGYDSARKGLLPPRPCVQVGIRFTTAGPRHLWMNRHYFLGIGRVSTADFIVIYDVYTVRERAPSAAGTVNEQGGCRGL